MRVVVSSAKSTAYSDRLRREWNNLSRVSPQMSRLPISTELPAKGQQF